MSGVGTEVVTGLSDVGESTAKEGQAAAGKARMQWIYGVEWSRDKLWLSRRFDILAAAITFLAVVAGYHIHMMLTVGDWDFWVDWKDRQYWVTITPVLAITFPAALQYITWEKFRLPIGATLCALALLVGEILTRVTAFHMWSGFPYSMVWPSTLLPGAIVLDVLLMLTGNFLVTAILGGLSFALLFWPANWVMLAAYHPPVEVMGNLASVADYIGYAFTRTATPEYLRFIERGTLRTFGGHSSVVSSFFAGFLCILTYLVWWFLGLALTKVLTVPNKMKKYMGL